MLKAKFITLVPVFLLSLLWKCTSLNILFVLSQERCRLQPNLPHLHSFTDRSPRECEETGWWLTSDLRIPPVFPEGRRLGSLAVDSGRMLFFLLHSARDTWIHTDGRQRAMRLNYAHAYVDFIVYSVVHRKRLLYHADVWFSDDHVPWS